MGGPFENSVSPGPETEMEYGFWTKKWDLNLELDNISWEWSIPLQPISLFLRVNKEGLCDGTKVRGIVSLVISSL